MRLLLAFLLIAISWQASAQSFRGRFTGAGLSGFRGYAGFGFAEFNVDNPPGQFSLDDGVYAFVGGERAINDDGLSFTISLSYTQTEGESFYNFSNLGGADLYTGNNVPFDMNMYQLSLGIKQRFFPNDWFRPFVEGGGIFSYNEIDHNPAAGAIACTGTCANPDDFKDNDTLTGFGYYAEAGVEVDFSDSYGVKVSGRYQATETREFDTLGNQTVELSTLIFNLSFLRKF